MRFVERLGVPEFITEEVIAGLVDGLGDLGLPTTVDAGGPPNAICRSVM